MSSGEKWLSGFKFLNIFYLLLIVILFFYSFTQVDLGLTLIRHPFWQPIQHFFQFIGYFERPLSTVLYLAILILLFIFYAAFLKLAHLGRIDKRDFWLTLIITVLILAFSYNAFSYDLFNYIFDAKIITHYHQNPYFHKALDYPGDPMLSFMHWTHRTYPYGPFWLFLTVPLSFLGFNFFLLTFFLFKFLMAGSFLGTVYFLSRILKKIDPANELFAIIFFAFNPLVIIESLVSSHNDIVMMFLEVFSLYLLFRNKYLFSVLAFLASIAVKFATVFLLPAFLLIFLMQKNGKKLDRRIWLVLIFSMVLPILIASARTNFQPWYLLYILPFTTLISKKYYIFIPVFIITFISLLTYVPFLYLGNWNPPVPFILLILTWSGVILSIIISAIWFIIKE